MVVNCDIVYRKHIFYFQAFNWHPTNCYSLSPPFLLHQGMPADFILNEDPIEDGKNHKIIELQDWNAVCMRF